MVEKIDINECNEDSSIRLNLMIKHLLERE